ncbi:ATP-dependent DNA helicase UvrD/PcrA [hydrothermal vent metagenome]|uniref:DNA 3'-5' helicase n=1 Tax=hydrothermal vent metagenome TaxID=652676 RepID=A0A3B1DHX0_9ZZZZ
MNINIFSNLNPSQREAVEYTDGPLLVLAGAGSGKTRIITSRIVYAIENGVPSTNILAVTFTNKAANEMKQRVRQHVQSYVAIGTFHSICLRILRQHAECVGRTPDFTIYDSQDQLGIIKGCMKELNIDPKAINPKHVLEKISRCKDYLQTPKNVAARQLEFEDRYFMPIYEKYEEKLQHANGMDFGDLISKTVFLFAGEAEVLEFYQERYKYILVDEYQDTNYAQDKFISLLAQKYRNITVVGDPDQSIYEWRGANIENIMRFEKVYKDAKSIRLEQNYRSTNTILKAANAVISCNQNRKDKNLWSEKGDGDLIEVEVCEDERGEAQYVLGQMVKLKREGYAVKDMVGFYRTHAQSRVLEEELMRQGVAYKIIGGQKFYARREIKDLLAYVRITNNSNDEISLMRIINRPKRGVGPAAVAKLTLFARQQKLSIYEATGVYSDFVKTPAKLKGTLKDFFEMIARFQKAAGELPLSQLLELIIEETGYVRLLEDENTIESKGRLENIKEFYSAVKEFQKSLDEDTTPLEALRAYLEFVSLQTDIDSWQNQEDVFTLMTLHSAKGLEFPVVFMLGMEEGVLPHMNAMNSSAKELEEERRLCYVGFTRAMEKLYLTYAGTRTIFGYEYEQTPSRFLYEIPHELLTQPVDEWAGVAF